VRRPLLGAAEVDVVLDQPAVDRAERPPAVQVVEEAPVAELAGAAVHAVGEGQLVTGRLPMEHQVAAWAGWGDLRRVDALPAQQLGDVSPQGRALEGLDRALVAQPLGEALGQGEWPRDQRQGAHGRGLPPNDPERVGLAAELGFSRNTVAKALDAFSGPDGPLLKRTVHEHDARGRLVRSRIELHLSPTCTGGVPGMLWALARFDQKRPEPEPPAALVCRDHPEAKVRVRHTAICTACGTVVAEHTATAPRPASAPTH
jgi:hypothetical protein